MTIWALLCPSKPKQCDSARRTCLRLSRVVRGYAWIAHRVRSSPLLACSLGTEAAAASASTGGIGTTFSVQQSGQYVILVQGRQFGSTSARPLSQECERERQRPGSPLVRLRCRPQPMGCDRARLRHRIRPGRSQRRSRLPGLDRRWRLASQNAATSEHRREVEFPPLTDSVGRRLWPRRVDQCRRNDLVRPRWDRCGAYRDG